MARGGGGCLRLFQWFSVARGSVGITGLLMSRPMEMSACCCCCCSVPGYDMGSEGPVIGVASWTAILGGVYFFGMRRRGTEGNARDGTLDARVEGGGGGGGGGGFGAAAVD